MAIYPRAVQRLKPHQYGEGAIVPRAVILHSICGGYSPRTAAGLDGLADPKNPLESHFVVDGDGTVYQLRDTEWHCDANLYANSFAVSIETESSVNALEPWSPDQYNAMVALTKWICETHNIPRRRIPTWDGAGIGYHVMWGSPSMWTPVAKSCPGPARVGQFRQVVVDVANEEWSADVISEADFRRIGAIVDARIVAHLYDIRKEFITVMSDKTHSYLTDELAPLRKDHVALAQQATDNAVAATAQMDEIAGRLPAPERASKAGGKK